MYTNRFICTLSNDVIEEIKHLLTCYLHDIEGICGSGLDGAIQNALDSRLTDIEEILDLDEYFYEKDGEIFIIEN